MLFSPVAAVKRAACAADTFPGRKVQLEGDYFEVNKFNASWVVGHVGVSEYTHKYFPLVCQISHTENESAVISMFQCAIDLVERLDRKEIKPVYALVDKILADGGTAIEAGVNSISSKREFEILLRRCFAHVTRMPRQGVEASVVERASCLVTYSTTRSRLK